MLLPVIIFGGGVVVGSISTHQLIHTAHPTPPDSEKISKPKWHQRFRNKLRHLSSNKTRDEQLYEMSMNVEIDTIEELTPAQKRVYQDLSLSLVATGMATVGLFIFPILLPLTAPLIIYIWRDVYIGAYQALIREKRITSDLIHALTAGAALIFGFFFAASLVSAIFGLSRLLLLKTQDQSRSTLLDVFALQSSLVWVIRDDTEIEVSIDNLERGDIVVVHAGEVIPVDGIIVDGIASVDQRILTGEAQPAEKEVGDSVFASTALLAGRIEINVQKTGAETTSAQIVEILNQTVDYRTTVTTRSEELQDRIAVPILIFSGLALATVGGAGALAVLNSNMLLSIMIVSPLSTLNFLNKASQHGILVKDGQALEMLAKVDTVVFDKTGTLTQEIPHVARLHVYDNISEAELLIYAAAAEYRQNHPVAKAILQAANDRKLNLPDIDAGDYKVGYGIKVTINAQVVRVGSVRFMEMEAIEIPSMLQDTMATCQKLGASLVMVALNNVVIGALELHPTIRPEVKTVIQALRQLGVQSMHLISGDHEVPTRTMADALGLDNYSAEVLPSQKATIMAQMQEEGRTVCYVGDGINDSIALKQANVSVSLRGASTVATDTAQVILMDENLEQLSHLFEIARDYNRNLTQCLTIAAIPGLLNIYGAFFLNFGLISSVICNQIGMWIGIGNALRPTFAQHDANHISENQIETKPKVSSAKTLTFTQANQ